MDVSVTIGPSLVAAVQILIGVMLLAPAAAYLIVLLSATVKRKR